MRLYPSVVWPLPMLSLALRHRPLLALGLLVVLTSPAAESLHLTGTWNGVDFFKFLARFGFQQTNSHDSLETQGYIYGNVSATDGSNATRRLVLVVVDSEYFLYYFGNRSHKQHTSSCELMFKKIDTIAWDGDCYQDGKEDFLRRVPCTRGSVCSEETDPKLVFPGYQFTYYVRDVSQPR
jgi:hypothetical protein